MNTKRQPSLEIALVLCLLPATARLQNISPFLGTKTPYAVTLPVKITTAPAGYEPVFINYTGRHGARFMTKPGADIEVLALLSYASEKKQLTEKGKLLKSMTERFLLIEKDNYENISLLGAAEQEAIGNRLYKNYPTIFRGQGIEMEMTHKVRTQQSAAAFAKGLDAYVAEKKQTVIAEGKDDVLRFYDLSPAYQEFKKSDGLKKSVDSLYADPRTRKTAGNICAELFTAALASELLNQTISIQVKGKSIPMDAVSFTENLYELYTIQFSIPVEMKQKGYEKKDIDFGIAFNDSELAWLDLVNGAQDFLEKGAGRDTAGLQVKVAIPLLTEYLNSTQEVIDQKRKTDAIFRFTHAEAISPFATLLGVRAASKPAASVFQYQKNWQTASIIPLSANICWVLYFNGKDYLVKILLNEKEVAVPVKTKQFPFYKWEDLKAYYLSKMQQLHTSPAADMHRYLLDLK